MLRQFKRIAVFVTAAGFLSSAAAENFMQLALLEQLRGFHPSTSARQFTVLNSKSYKNTVQDSRDRVNELLKNQKRHRHLTLNAQVAHIAKELADIPYLATNAMGEGDWQPTSKTYIPGAVHVKQQPVYRLDGLDCQTFVQVAMALLHANSLENFDRAYLKISYGAAGNPDGEVVRYYNRNNFIDADFNPVNRRNGWLTDVTGQGELASYSKSLNATVTRINWFMAQQQNLANNVIVLSTSDGPDMVERFKTTYTHLDFPRFDEEKIKIRYIPKDALAIREPDGEYMPNQALLDAIPTPAIAEMVRDVNRWSFYGRKVKDIIGSELTISHLGILYRQTFKKDELIYRKITCEFDRYNRKVCDVTPISCEQSQCRELMFVHATNAYPASYSWYKNADGNYVCSPLPAPKGVVTTSCNRVIATPFFDYLTDYQAGTYWNMETPSFLGVHIEALS